MEVRLIHLFGCNDFLLQSAELMRQYGINVPDGIPVKSLDEVPEAAKELADASGEVWRPMLAIRFRCPPP